MTNQVTVTQADEYLFLALQNAGRDEALTILANARIAAEQRGAERSVVTMAERLWIAQTAFSVFEDELYDMLGGETVDPFDHCGEDCYDMSLEIYGLKTGVEITPDVQDFIKRHGFTRYYTDRKGSPEKLVRDRRQEIRSAVERERERSARIAEADEAGDWTDGVPRGGIIAEKIRQGERA